MTQQEIIERDVRLTLGDLSLQLIMARARVQELEERLAEWEKNPPVPFEQPTKANGKAPMKDTLQP